jgi:hypothetical protein
LAKAALLTPVCWATSPWEKPSSKCSFKGWSGWAKVRRAIFFVGDPPLGEGVFLFFATGSFSFMLALLDH